MAVDSLAVGLGVGVTVLILLVISLVMVYVFCWRNEKRLSRMKRIKPRPARSYEMPSWGLQPNTQQPIPVTQTPAEAGWYNNGYQYGRTPEYGNSQTSWPQQTIWYASPYGAAGATGDNNQGAKSGILPWSNQTSVPLSVVNVNQPDKSGFILPKLPKPEPFILPTTKTDLELPKDSFSNFILPTDKEAIIDEFGTDDFILPKIEWKKEEDTITDVHKALQEGPIVNTDTAPAYNPYALPAADYGGSTEAVFVKEPFPSQPAYNPYSSYQPYKPIQKPGTEQPKLPPAEATKPDNANQVYYHASENTTSPAKQQQQQHQQQPGKADKPAKQPEVLYYMTADPTGAPVPTSSVASLVPAVPATTTTSYTGYAVQQATSCASNPEQPGQMTCTSTKNVYHLEPVPNANGPNQLMWVAEPSRG